MSEEARDDERTVAAEEHEAEKADSTANVALGLLISIVRTYCIPGEIAGE
jgi:hypothetical protein